MPTAGSGGVPAMPDPTPADAAPDAAPGTSDADTGSSPPPVAALESLVVTGAGDVVTTRAKLDAGELYLLKASGVIELGVAKIDAEFDGAGKDSAGAVDVGIDNGMKDLILPGAGSAAPMVSANRMKWFGPARADHTYYMVVTGAGVPLGFKLLKPAGAPAGLGGITVSLFHLTPAADVLGKALESVMVPFKPRTATAVSLLKPAAGSVYLLRAFGEAQVGGAGNNGDAEFDDYKGGTSANEGEGGKDFGVCVDEPCSVKRVRKWGPYRKDHNYYMLYGGNGMVINFAYCDTGTYNDNAGGLPVELYAVP